AAMNRLKHRCCALIRKQLSHFFVFGTRGSEVQILSPRPLFSITSILTTLRGHPMGHPLPAACRRLLCELVCFFVVLLGTVKNSVYCAADSVDSLVPPDFGVDVERDVGLRMPHVVARDLRSGTGPTQQARMHRAEAAKVDARR